MSERAHRTRRPRFAHDDQVPTPCRPHSPIHAFEELFQPVLRLRLVPTPCTLLPSSLSFSRSPFRHPPPSSAIAAPALCDAKKTSLAVPLSFGRRGREPLEESRPGVAWIQALHHGRMRGAAVARWREVICKSVCSLSRAARTRWKRGNLVQGQEAHLLLSLRPLASTSARR